jgi:N-acetylglucosamine kinase-like BadF-type ATPase
VTDSGAKFPGATPAVLAIDGGNSKTALVLVADDGTVLASVRGPAASQEAYGIDGAMLRLGEMVREVAAKAGIPRGGLVARHTSACLAGADLPEEETALTAALGAQGWSESAIAVNDTLAVLRAGLRVDHGEPAWGTVVTCGAGINCVAVGPDGQVARYLAFGKLTGDFGGGGDLGREVMWHAIRAEDGRGPATALEAAVTEHFGVARVADVAIAVHKGNLGNDDVRNLTRVLMAVADAGDAVACDLLARQAAEICLMAVAAMKRIGVSPEGAPVALGGGVLESRNPVLLRFVTSSFAEMAPGALPRVVDVPPVAGAALLGLDHVGASAAAEHTLRAAYASGAQAHSRRRVSEGALVKARERQAPLRGGRRLCWERGHVGDHGHHDPACPCRAGRSTGHRAGPRLRGACRSHLAAAPRRAADAGRA